MNLKSELERPYTKAYPEQIANYVGSNANRFDQLMTLFLGDHVRITHHGSHAINASIKKHPQLILPYLEQWTSLLSTPINDTVKRNIIRTFQFINIPENIQGQLFENCSKLLINPQTSVGIRAFCITVLYKICEIHHDLKPELEEMIYMAMEHSDKPAIHFRGKKTLKLLDKLN